MSQERINGYIVVKYRNPRHIGIRLYTPDHRPKDKIFQDALTVHYTDGFSLLRVSYSRNTPPDMLDFIHQQIGKLAAKHTGKVFVYAVPETIAEGEAKS